MTTLREPNGEAHDFLDLGFSVASSAAEKSKRGEQLLVRLPIPFDDNDINVGCDGKVFLRLGTLVERKLFRTFFRDILEN